MAAFLVCHCNPCDHGTQPTQDGPRRAAEPATLAGFGPGKEALVGKW